MAGGVYASVYLCPGEPKGGARSEVLWDEDSQKVTKATKMGKGLSLTRGVVPLANGLMIVMQRVFNCGARLRGFGLVVAVLLAGLVAGCKTAPRPGTFAPRKGDEIVVAGQFFHTGARVVLWMDPGGYDAYRVERRFSPLDKADWETSHAEVKDLDIPNRYNLRQQRPDGRGNRARARRRLGFAAAATRGRSVRPSLRRLRHQPAMFQGAPRHARPERAFHARSGRHDLPDARREGTRLARDLLEQPLRRHRDRQHGRVPGRRQEPVRSVVCQRPNGEARITIPPQFGDGGILTKNFVGHPARPEPVTGTIQGKELMQYDFTPQQYQALIKLTAALCKALPKIKCDYPRDAAGKLIRDKLPDAELEAYQGVLGHFHIQTNKVDPGPAFQWDHVIGNARKLLRGGMSEPADETSKGHLRPRS